MRQVPANGDTVRVAVACDELDVEELARVELYTGEQDECGRGGVFGDDGQDVFGGDVGRGGRGRFDGDEGRGVEIVVGDLREGGVLRLILARRDSRWTGSQALTWSLGNAFPSMMIFHRSAVGR